MKSPSRGRGRGRRRARTDGGIGIEPKQSVQVGTRTVVIPVSTRERTSHREAIMPPVRGAETVATLLLVVV